tara:strand:+ start:1247 stop:1633 length:387 start_codon:yes stop_codon:yes gene_type:complete
MFLLTEWLLTKLKALYAGKIYEGTTQKSSKELRLAWAQIISSMGRDSVLATYDFLQSGHEAIPNFAPSPVEFKKLAQVHVMPFIRYKNKFKLLKFESKHQKADEKIARKYLGRTISNLKQAKGNNDEN